MHEIVGIGLVSENALGCVRTGESFALNTDGANPSLQAVSSLFKRKIEHFGRFDPVSRVACYACVLALHDAGQDANPNSRIGIIGAGYTGSVRANHTFFKDFVDAGRILARGNLFVYTLPTAPLCEAAIHFGLRGPVHAIISETAPLAHGIESACSILDDGDAPAMLVVQAEDTCAIAALISSSVTPASQPPLLAWLKDNSQDQPNLTDLTRAFTSRVSPGAKPCE